MLAATVVEEWAARAVLEERREPGERPALEVLGELRVLVARVEQRELAARGQAAA